MPRDWGLTNRPGKINKKGTARKISLNDDKHYIVQNLQRTKWGGAKIATGD